MEQDDNGSKGQGDRQLWILANIARHLARPLSYEANSWSASQIRAISLWNSNDLPRRLLVVGAPGSGKSTALKVALADLAAAHLGDPTRKPAPVWIQAQGLARALATSTLLTAFVSVLAGQLGELVSEQEVEAHLCEGRLTLVVDGLDEVPSDSSLAKELSNLFAAYPKLSGILSSRPSALAINIPGFVVFEMPNLDTKAVAELIQGTGEEAGHLLAPFISALQAYPTYLELTRSPLLAMLLWRAFRERGRLPNNLADLLGDFVDAVIRREIAKTQAAGSLAGEVLEVLGRAALELRASGQFELPIERLRAISLEVAGTIDGPRLLSFFCDRIALMEQRAEGQLTFVHRLLFDYFTLWALRDEPDKVIRIVADEADLSLLAVGLVADPAPIVASILERGEVVLAARCVAGARAVSDALRRVVADRLRDSLGPSVLSLLGFNPAAPAPEPIPRPAGHDDLLVALSAAIAKGQTANARGRSLEEFGRRFFGSVFEIIDERYWTEAGEIDLIAEITLTAPFWREFGGDVFIECKNWEKETPLAMEKVSAFMMKLEQRRVRLGFILSAQGFSRAAEEVIRGQAPNPEKPLIVPLATEDVRDALQRGEPIELFLKERIRATKYRRRRPLH